MIFTFRFVAVNGRFSKFIGLSSPLLPAHLLSLFSVSLSLFSLTATNRFLLPIMWGAAERLRRWAVVPGCCVIDRGEEVIRMLVLHGMSALSYYRTPVQVVQAAMDPVALLDGTPKGEEMYRLLSVAHPNENDETRIVRERALSDLMGVSLPIDVCTGRGCSLRPNAVIRPHRLPRHQDVDELVSLGGGAYVPSIPQLFLELSRGRSVIELSLLMMEACGLFTVFHETPQAKTVLRVLKSEESEKGLRQENERPFCNAYYDESGKRLSFLNEHGEQRPWRQTVTSGGVQSDMWSRPPLTTSEELISFYSNRLEWGVPGARKALAAAQLVLDGAASPLEAKFALMQFAPASLGGDNWPRPWLNRRVNFIPELQELAGRAWCSCDEVWPDAKVDIEVNGESFHADERGFQLESGRRAALEAMGYRVLEVTSTQMANFDSLEVLAFSFSDVLGFHGAPRDARFCTRRRKLHEEVMAFRY